MAISKMFSNLCRLAFPIRRSRTVPKCCSIYVVGFVSIAAPLSGAAILLYLLYYDCPKSGLTRIELGV